MDSVTIKPFHGDSTITLTWERFIQAISSFDINLEDWECSDYSRKFHGFVAYLRHFSDGDFSSHGQFTTPFIVTSFDVSLGDCVPHDLARTLRAVAFLRFGKKVLAERAISGRCSVSGAFEGEWFKTTSQSVEALLRDLSVQALMGF